MNVTSALARRSARLFTSLALAFTGVLSVSRGDEKSARLDTFPRFESYLKITGQAAAVSGNAAAFARRLQLPENGAYGLEALHLGKELGKDVTMEVDGRALTGSENYLGKMLFTKTDVGSFEFGYKRFRTFYDGIGGFFPVKKYWQPLKVAELHTDRAKFWANVKINLPNQPVFEFSYVNELRNGQKDTTIWGDTDFTGIPISTVASRNPYSSNRKLVPSYLDLNERQQTLLGVMKHKVGNTEYEVEIVSNRTNSLDTRWLNRYPGELKPFPAIPTNPPSIIPPALANNPNVGFDTQGSKANVLTYTGKFETKLTTSLGLFGGLSYQNAGADISGNRQIALVIMTTPGVVSAVGGFTSGGRPPYSYTTVAGRTHERVVTGNLGLTYTHLQDFRLSLALKNEKLDMDGTNQVNYLNNLIVQSTGVVTPITVAAPNLSSRHEKTWIPELTVRYAGIKDLALYGSLDYRHSPGEETGLSTGVSPSGTNVLPSVVSSADNTKLNHGHYKVGANWTVNPFVTLRGEFFYKDHTNSYTDIATAGAGYVLGYEFQGTKFTAIVKAAPTVTFTTRYVGQHGRMHTIIDAGARYDSMNSRNHLFGETIDWNPTPQVYFQANANVVFATLSTVYPRAGLTANDVLHNADNNYVNGSLVTGFAVDKKTDAQLQFTYYRADNYQPAVIVSLPYGAGVKESTLAVELKHKFSDRLIGRAKIGYFHSQNETTGGNTNYRGPLAYLSFEHSL